MQPVISGFLDAVRPPERITFEKWAQHVKIVDGKSPYFDVDQAPWAREAMARLVDHDTRELLLIWPTGSGKSTLFEAWFCWIAAQTPKSLQCSLANDDQAKRWVEKRVMPTLRNCEPVTGIMDSLHRHKTRKLEIVFPQHTFYFGGANMGRLQDVSVPLVLGQETWDWKDGAMQQAKARDHDRWDAKTVFAGQGGMVGTEWHSEAEDCETREFQFRCPGCRRYAPWIERKEDPREAFEEALTWDREECAKDDPDWAKVMRSVRLVTRCCGRELADTARNRRRLAMAGKYRSLEDHHVPGWVALTVTALAYPHVPWGRLVREYVLARHDEMAGITERMKAFVTKRLAWMWQESIETPQIDTSRERYGKMDYWPEKGHVPRWEDEIHRFLTVDVQKDHYWVVARAWKISGDSLLLYEGRVETIELVRELQVRLDVPNPNVGIDVGYEPDRLAGYRQRFRDPITKDGKVAGYTYWFCFKGDQGAGYPSTPGGPRRAFSNYVNTTSTAGTPYRLVKFSNLLVKDCLAGLINSERLYFGVFHDHSKEYGRQMRGEHKVEYRPGQYRWEKVTDKAPNHLWDCECLQVVLASLKRILKIETVQE